MSLIRNRVFALLGVLCCFSITFFCINQTKATEDIRFRAFLFSGKLPSGEPITITAAYESDETIPGCLVIALPKLKGDRYYPVTDSVTRKDIPYFDSVEIDDTHSNVVSSGRWYVLQDDKLIASGTLRQHWSYFLPLFKKTVDSLLLGLILQK